MSLKLPRTWDFSTFKAETARIVRSRSVVSGEGGSGSLRSSKSMERPLKAGWLKKQHQRTLVKNWQHRYFVLRGSTLTYHKDDKETTIQGFIHLQFSKVNEVPPSSDDPGKYLFEIVPHARGDRERCSIVFMAASQSDMEEWVRTLRKVIGVPTSGVFGKSLMDTVTNEQRSGPHMVPILVQKCVEYIREHGLNEEGIFRLPGQDNAVKHFRDAFDAGERPSFPRDTDVHTVASLLKLYLRELPEPVVPWSQYHDFLECVNVPDLNTKEGRVQLEKQIALLPRVNYNLLSYICRFLFEVQLNANVNKMNVENLAMVMGINLLKPQMEDPFSVMKATPLIQKLTTVMIRQHEILFPLAKDVHPSPPSNKADTPRSFVGWESAEMAESESPEEDNDSPGPHTAKCSVPDTSFSTDNKLVSPRKRTQTLPVFSCPTVGMAAKAEALSQWNNIQESAEDKSSTLSEDIFKILDLSSATSLLGKKMRDSRSSSSEESQRLAGDTKPPQATLSPKSPETPKHIGKSQSYNSKLGNKKDDKQFVDSLQQENKELKATVAELQSALEAERRRAAALEICLKNAERSRDEAQRCNEELKRDIQQFLRKELQAPT